MDRIWPSQACAQKLHHRGSEHVHAEEAEVVAGAKPGNHQALLGFGGRGFFDHRFHAVKAGPAGTRRPATTPKLGKQIFPGGLDPGNRARLELPPSPPGAGRCLRCGQIQMISHQVEEGLIGHKLARTIDGVAVAQRLWLRDESHGTG